MCRLHFAARRNQSCRVISGNIRSKSFGIIFTSSCHLYKSGLERQNGRQIIGLHRDTGLTFIYHSKMLRNPLHFIFFSKRKLPFSYITSAIVLFNARVRSNQPTIQCDLFNPEFMMIISRLYSLSLSFALLCLADTKSIRPFITLKQPLKRVSSSSDAIAPACRFSLRSKSSVVKRRCVWLMLAPSFAFTSF